MQNTNKNTSNLIFKIFKILSIVFAGIYIFIKLKDENLFYFSDTLTSLNYIKYFLLALVIILMLLNWLIESVKWKFLIHKIQKISLSESIKAVLSGLTVSIYTPNRVGEYFGRIFVLHRKKRVRGIIITIIGSISQLLITLLVGSTALIIAINFNKVHNSFLSQSILTILVVLANILFITFYFKISILYKFLSKFNFFKKNKSKIKVINMYNFNDLVKVFYLSFLRYVIFVNQFFILIYIFNVDLKYEEAIFAISLTYLVSAIIPSFALSEIGIKTSALIFFISMFTNNTSGAFAAIFSLWIINIVIPSIAGSFFLAKQKI